MNEILKDSRKKLKKNVNEFKTTSYLCTSDNKIAGNVSLYCAHRQQQTSRYIT